MRIRLEFVATAIRNYTAVKDMDFANCPRTEAGFGKNPSLSRLDKYA